MNYHFFFIGLHVQQSQNPSINVKWRDLRGKKIRRES